MEETWEWLLWGNLQSLEGTPSPEYVEHHNAAYLEVVK
jgi:hypothetical protein